MLPFLPSSRSGERKDCAGLFLAERIISYSLPVEWNPKQPVLSGSPKQTLPRASAEQALVWPAMVKGTHCLLHSVTALKWVCLSVCVRICLLECVWWYEHQKNKKERNQRKRRMNRNRNNRRKKKIEVYQCGDKERHMDKKGERWQRESWAAFVCECVCGWAGLLHQSNIKSPGQELRLSTFKPPWALVNWLAYTMPRQLFTQRDDPQWQSKWIKGTRKHFKLGLKGMEAQRGKGWKTFTGIIFYNVFSVIYFVSVICVHYLFVFLVFPVVPLSLTACLSVTLKISFLLCLVLISLAAFVPLPLLWLSARGDLYFCVKATCTNPSETLHCNLTAASLEM